MSRLLAVALVGVSLLAAPSDAERCIEFVVVAGVQRGPFGPQGAWIEVDARPGPPMTGRDADGRESVEWPTITITPTAVGSADFALCCWAMGHGPATLPLTMCVPRPRGGGR